MYELTAKLMFQTSYILVKANRTRLKQHTGIQTTWISQNVQSKKTTTSTQGICRHLAANPEYVRESGREREREKEDILGIIPKLRKFRGRTIYTYRKSFGFFEIPKFHDFSSDFVAFELLFCFNLLECPEPSTFRVRGSSLGCMYIHIYIYTHAYIHACIGREAESEYIRQSIT